MQLKTVEEVANQIWNAGSKLTHNDLDAILAQDRADIRTVLKAALDQLEAPMSNDPYYDSYSGYGRAISDAISVIDTLLPGDVSK